MSERKTLPPEYFDGVYAANDDPWNFTSSEYEAGKYAVTLDSLPEKHYRNAFEIGCSIGVLTEKLATKCFQLLAVDVSEKALTQAKKRCENLPNVHLQMMRMPDEFPDETFDLILISEVGYYLAPKDWLTMMEKIFAHLTEAGQVALVHWTPHVHDYPQTGDAVHDSFAEYAGGEMRNLKSFRNEKYRLDIWGKFAEI